MGTGVFEHSDNKAKAEMVAATKEILALAEKHSFIQS
jgi:hypothetical protein